MQPDTVQIILEWIELNEVLVYLLLFAYCATKSGLLPFFAGLVAATGALEPLVVFCVSFLGGYLGDELRFFLARRYGANFVAVRPRLRDAISSATELLNKYGAGYIFLYRYPKGMRTIGALPVGLGTMSWRRFTWLNAASAALWSVIFVGVGYVFGDQLREFAIQKWTEFSLILLALFILLITYLFWQHRFRDGPISKTVANSD